MSDRLVEALRATLTNPRGAARTVLSWKLGWGPIGLILALGVALTLLVSSVDLALSGAGDRAMPSLLSPGVVGLLAGSVLVQGALALWIGRAFGGWGDARRVGLAVAWANLAQAVLMGAADFLGLLLPSDVSVALFVLAAVWSLWILACFVAEAHGFARPGQVLFAIFGLAIGLGVVLAIILGAAGVAPPGAG